MPAHGDYLRDPEAIYRASFAAIRREAPIERLPRHIQALATRLIHACAMPDILPELAWTPDALEAGVRALTAGRPILVDAAMVAAGIRRERLPAENPIVCTLGDPVVDFCWSLQYWAEPGDRLTFLQDPPTLNPIFGAREAVAARYAERSGLSLHERPYYFAFGWWKMACIVEGVYARLKKALREE